MFFFDLCLGILNLKILIDENILSFKFEIIKNKKDLNTQGTSHFNKKIDDLNNENESTNEEIQLKKH